MNAGREIGTGVDAGAVDGGTNADAGAGPGVVDGTEDAAEGAWNPGLSSSIPRRLRPAVTLFRDEHAAVGFDAASELADLSGLPVIELAALRPERLITHELLVRVTADYTVPDGPNYADLGISLRAMVAALAERHVAPELDAIRAAFEAERARWRAGIEEELERHALGLAIPPGVGGGVDIDADRAGKADLRRGAIGAAGAGERADARGAERDGGIRSLLGRVFGGGGRERETRGAGHARTASPAARPGEPSEATALAAWRDALEDDSLPASRRACLEALARTVEAIVARRGRLLADRPVLRDIALILVGNSRGAALVGELVAPIVERGAAAEGYRLLPVQAKPVVMNVKGASASGKSTIRPRQRRLADALGIPWEDFALISPDYWRKYLLDYASLGDDARYAAMLCGEELAIVDRKLDRHMADKARAGRMSHLLIDRFRFDSFTLDEDRTADSRLLTRFGHELYLFFMVTPPVETVERAWIRGQLTGRYKAVDDLLHHNVEAYTGMPALFLSWITARDKRVHVEFLDNDVPEGTLPLTAAFGWNDRLTILDVALMCRIDRYREVNVGATRPEDVLPERDGDAPAEPAFLLRCAARVARIDFADRESAHVYARVENGKLVWTDEAHVAAREDAAVVRAVLDALACAAPSSRPTTAASVEAEERPAPIDVARESRVTVGRWASAVTSGATSASDDERPPVGDASRAGAETVTTAGTVAPGGENGQGSQGGQGGQGGSVQ